MSPTKQAILSLLRSLLIAGGAWAVGKGYITEPGMNEVVGAVTVLVTALWGFFDKLKADK